MEKISSNNFVVHRVITASSSTIYYVEIVVQLVLHKYFESDNASLSLIAIENKLVLYPPKSIDAKQSMTDINSKGGLGSRKKFKLR